MSETVSTAPTPPFATKKAIREAISLGSRWSRGLLADDAPQVGTVVRASSTRRWVRWDGDDAGSPMSLSVSDTRWWRIEVDGFSDAGDGGEHWRLVAPAPADVNLEALAQAARRPNDRDDVCGTCGGPVAASAGYVQSIARWSTVHYRDGDCLPVKLRAPRDGREHRAMPRNRHPGDCALCGAAVEALEGYLRRTSIGWQVLHGWGHCAVVSDLPEVHTKG